MKPYTRLALLITLLAAGSCIGSGGETKLGTESGNPRTFATTCECETDADCEGLFDWQIEMYDASVRSVECSAETRACRAVLEADGQCYVNLAVDSRAYDCALTDQEIFEQSESDPDRPLDAAPNADSCE
jgi:hypothetical protein